MKNIDLEYMQKAKNIIKDREMTFASKTFGCQMNENDSEIVSGILTEMGYCKVDDFSKSDFIFFNTCCVRENAEEKTFGWLGGLKKIKNKNPNLIICMMGCMMQEKHMVEKIKKSFPYVDLIVGTDNIHKLPKLIYNHMTKNKKCIEISHDKYLTDIDYVKRDSKYQAYLTIIKGCNNFCSYCIVPYVRGREKSYDMSVIFKKVESLALKGYKEITLLGQNVNSYGNDIGMKEGFSRLLKNIETIDGIKRIKFMTSHPKDLSDKLIYTIRDSDKIVNYIHLPLQSGSTKVLQDMNRGYSKEHYLNLVDKIKKELPNVAITTDIIIGFPGENEKDFQDTYDVVKKVKYDSAYIFLYSPRKGTSAYRKTEIIDEKIAKDRFNRLLKLQHENSFKSNKKTIGSIYNVLVEGISKKDKSMYTGRTYANKLVHFKGDNKLIGKFVNVKITNAQTFSLEGEIVNE